MNPVATDTSPATTSPESQVYAPGTTVKIRDEEWLVESSSQDGDMVWLTVRGLRGIVQDTVAMFSPDLDVVEEVSPAETQIVADDSPKYRRSRLWLEAVLRKNPEPVGSTAITVAREGLVDALDYQVEAVRKAIGEDNPRTRILLADAVGLGKTIEIGMILSELVRRGKGERILIVTPRHVLEQTQLELWSRFGLPFARLDSAGIQRVRQHIPATRNPFTYYPRAIVSIDTLKSDQYVHQIARQHWDAVVIDESHNLSNSETLNNRLARNLANNTDALILASATPHNGRADSFAELVRLLDPTAVTPGGDLRPSDVEHLVIRRHRHSKAVASEVGSDWAERLDPVQLLIHPTAAEDAVATELSQTWLHPESGRSPVTDKRGAEALFPWTLAKAFLSSPAALLETIESRKRRAKEADKLGPEEDAALDRLADLTRDAVKEKTGKFNELVAYLRKIGVQKGSPTRAVVFAERVATLHWLEENLPKALGMPKDAFAVMHGSLGDMDQQRIVDEFSRESSPLRVLITGDVASEGVNLHKQCHNLIHYDLPWSLIRIEQRNGRIDRYGQRNSPRIAMLVLQPSDEKFSGDIRILAALLEREHEAHHALGESSSLMGQYSVPAEENEIAKVLAGRQDLDEVVLAPKDVVDEGDAVSSLFAQLFGAPEDEDEGEGEGEEEYGYEDPATVQHSGPRHDAPNHDAQTLYDTEIDFLADALQEAFPNPAARSPEGVSFQYSPQDGIAKFTPPRDLVQRLEVLPQTYLQDRRVTETVVLATNKAQGQRRMDAARADKTGSSWPDASYLTPLHPVLEWATDRSLASLGRGRIFAVRANVTAPTILMLTTLANTTGAVAAASWMGVQFPDPANPSFRLTEPFASAEDAVSTYRLNETLGNPGPVARVGELQALVPPAVEAAEGWAQTVFQSAQDAAQSQLEQWQAKSRSWKADADTLIQTKVVRDRKEAVDSQAEFVRGLAPSRRLVRPILMMVPEDWPVAATVVEGGEA